ncbi:pantoate--beta-alanine ligase [Corticibacterium sp. UT-5YL-CI-8]|nr:pantoate--beta-alanine ligase [Tianweitania sp. UT-5YL-CI-8]
MTATAITVRELRATVSGWRREGLSVGFVPTMGALHDGHISLVELALRKADRCVVSIFVNPRQFGPTEDLDKYPRQLAADMARLKAAGAHLAFTPSVKEMYPAGFATAVSVGGPSQGLETDFRPQFFDGVATVVSKLLLQVSADCAVFGEKDYQQLCVIRQLSRDLDIPTEIIGGPTMRDAEGLAMSSRNAYLSTDELGIARKLNVILRTAATAIVGGEHPDSACIKARSAIGRAGFSSVDYVAARESETLAAWQKGRPGRILAAAWIGRTRLIDNLEIASH